MYLASERFSGSVTETALGEFERVYSYVYSRVGNRADAEDLTQQVALKALPRLRDGYPEPAVRAYLFATARTVMASFWSGRALVPEAELTDDLWIDGRGVELASPPNAAAWLERTLAALPNHYRRVLEFRFLRGYSLRETAVEMGTTIGNIKVMQLRALRAAARVTSTQ
jgi:RNA polymerase sigma-70 factor (ECF subfamily)